jgi:hypothetical protein
MNRFQHLHESFELDPFARVLVINYSLPEVWFYVIYNREIMSLHKYGHLERQSLMWCLWNVPAKLEWAGPSMATSIFKVL